MKFITDIDEDYLIITGLGKGGSDSLRVEKPDKTVYLCNYITNKVNIFTKKELGVTSMKGVFIVSSGNYKKRIALQDEIQHKINYKELLKKYIDYIDDVEGSNFVSQVSYKFCDKYFTEEEWAELKKLAE